MILLLNMQVNNKISCRHLMQHDQESIA